MGSFQEKLGDIIVTGSAGGGMVEVDINGKMEVLAVRIADESMDDKEMLQDLIAASVNSAMDKIREAVNRELGNMMPGGIPPGFPGTPPGFPGFPT